MPRKGPALIYHKSREHSDDCRVEVPCGEDGESIAINPSHYLLANSRIEQSMMADRIIVLSGSSRPAVRERHCHSVGSCSLRLPSRAAFRQLRHDIWDLLPSSRPVI